MTTGPDEAFQVVILNQFEAEPEILHVLPHRYATIDEASDEVDALEIWKPSELAACWSIRSTAELARRQEATR